MMGFESAFLLFAKKGVWLTSSVWMRWTKDEQHEAVDWALVKNRTMPRCVQALPRIQQAGHASSC